MSTVGPEGRSFELITLEDLARLAAIAEADRAEFFNAHPDWASLYADRLLCTALCQGAALHYVSGPEAGIGINDFDVYSFYAAHPARPWYAKRNKHWDFGDPKFGHSVEKAMPIGRRVDLLGRGIPSEPGDYPVVALRRWLRAGATETARRLSEKAVVLLGPREYLGLVVWPLVEHRGHPSLRPATRMP